MEKQRLESNRKTSPHKRLHFHLVFSIYHIKLHRNRKPNGSGQTMLADGKKVY